MVTRRCAHQQYMLTPNAQCSNAVIYCIVVAAQKTGVSLLDFMTMPNHLHDVLFDPHGNLVPFYEEFHRLLAKCRNVQLGRWESFFDNQQTNVVRLETIEAVIEKLVYIATNPVTAGLVEKVEHWPGAFGYLALVRGEPLRATRPTEYFDPEGDMPAEVTYYLRIPPELGDHDTIVNSVKRRVEATEDLEWRRRQETGGKVLGRNAVMRRSWKESPATPAPRRRLRPTIAGKELAKRLQAIQRRRDFLAMYRVARQALLAGTPIPFPHGTYWLKRFMNVAVEPACAENN